mmetsp:Transcript_17159/g.52787  ORF Transcript_17159/g.52787 Transcript_17159/m.52787 type:complete len:146 (+) Transcript_17159:762-1199(+)
MQRALKFPFAGAALSVDLHARFDHVDRVGARRRDHVRRAGEAELLQEGAHISRVATAPTPTEGLSFEGLAGLRRDVAAATSSLRVLEHALHTRRTGTATNWHHVWSASWTGAPLKSTDRTRIALAQIYRGNRRPIDAVATRHTAA